MGLQGRAVNRKGSPLFRGRGKAPLVQIHSQKLVIQKHHSVQRHPLCIPRHMQLIGKISQKGPDLSGGGLPWKAFPGKTDIKPNPVQKSPLGTLAVSSQARYPDAANQEMDQASGTSLCTSIHCIYSQHIEVLSDFVHALPLTDACYHSPI